MITNFIGKQYMYRVWKNLGVILNSVIKFKHQVAPADKKANKTLGMIKRNFEYINKEAFEVLYGTLVRPQLKYAVHLLSPCQIDLREKLEQSQRRVTKWVRNIKHKVMKKDLMSTLDRWERGDVVMSYKILNHSAVMDARFMKMNTESRTRVHTQSIMLHIWIYLYLSSPVDDHLVGCVHHSLIIVNITINSHMACFPCYLNINMFIAPKFWSNRGQSYCVTI